MMKSEETEKRILEKMKEIVEICKENDPCFHYITLSYLDGFIDFSNDFWRKPVQTQINYCEKMEVEA